MDEHYHFVSLSDAWNYAVDPRCRRNYSLRKQTCDYVPLPQMSAESVLGVDSALLSIQAKCNCPKNIFMDSNALIKKICL